MLLLAQLVGRVTLAQWQSIPVGFLIKLEVRGSNPVMTAHFFTSPPTKDYIVHVH
jgi:hypothetical protein